MSHAAFKPVVILSQFLSLLSKLSFLSLNESALRTKFGIVEGIRQDSIPCLAHEKELVLAIVLLSCLSFGIS